MKPDFCRSLFLANATSNLVFSQVMLARPQAILSLIRAPLSSTLAMGMVRYRGGLHLAYLLLSLQGLLKHGFRERRVDALILGVSGVAQCCLDWMLLRHGMYCVLPVALIDAGLVAANLCYYLMH